MRGDSGGASGEVCFNSATASTNSLEQGWFSHRGSRLTSMEVPPTELFSSATEFKTACFSVELGLPPADESLFHDAKTAVRQEFRECSKWKRLRCRKVSVF